jgi:hypothetical protein
MLPLKVLVKYCFECGRDLRLPVARSYGPGSFPDAGPDRYEGQRWWIDARHLEPDSYSYVEALDVLSCGGFLFGPVTISPAEVPE